MHIRSDGTFVRTDIWREGKWFDLWSIVHFLSGGSLGFVLHFFGFEGISAAVIAFLLMVVYEFWEAAAKIEEYGSNRFADVIIGMASFCLVVFLLVPGIDSGSQFYIVFGVVLFINLVLSIMGWKASQKAKVFEKRLRQAYRAERKKLEGFTHFHK